MSDLGKLISWGKANENVTGLLLTGSRARPHLLTDQFSDYDIVVIGPDFPYLENNDWLIDIGPYWVCVPERYEMLGSEVPTRLVIFHEGFKTDFSFVHPDLIQKIITSGKLPDGFNLGYRVLLDKNGILIRLPAPENSGFKLKKPDLAEYNRIVDEFWFEVFHVVKYLVRGDLWAANTRQFDARKLLFTMICWDHANKAGWNFSPRQEGREMKQWVEPAVWEKVEGCNGSLKIGESWKAIKNMISLFSILSRKTAHALQFSYNEDLENKMTAFIKNHDSKIEI